MLRCKTFGALVRRFFSAVSISTNWRRRVTSASSAWACSLANGRAAGRTASPKRASISASSRSVLASLPVARAKSRTCLGLTIATAIPAVAKALATGTSRPPVASRITKSAGASCLSNSRIPTSLLATEKAAPADPMNTSNATLATSIPTIVSPLLGAVSEHGCCWIVAFRVVPHFYMFVLHKTVPFLGLSVR